MALAPPKLPFALPSSLRPESAARPRCDRLAGLAARLLDAATVVLFARDVRGARVVSAHGLAAGREAFLPLEHISDEVLAIADLAQAPGSVAAGWASVEHAARSCAIAPVRNEHGTTVGALAVLATRVRRWTVGETALLEDLAAVGGELLAALAPGEERPGASTERPARDTLPRSPTVRPNGRSAQYRALARNLPEGVVVLYDGELRVTLAHGTALATAGLTALEGLPLAVALPREVVELLTPNILAALRGDSSERQVHVGAAVYRVRLHPVRSDEGAIVGGMLLAHDVTQHAADERALRESEARYRLLFERARDSICVVHLDPTRGPMIVDANPATLELHGYTLDELLEMRITDLNTPEFAAVASERFRPLVEDGEWIELEAEGMRKDGTRFPVELSAGPLDPERRLILAIARDVTARKSAEARYRLLFERARDSICIVQTNFQTGPTIVEANPATSRMHGYSNEELRGFPIRDLLAPASRPLAAEKLRGVHEEGVLVDVELEGIRKDGTTFPLEISATSLDRARGLVLSIARDVTERKHAEAALIAAKNAAEQANRAKTAFLANMSHEIRTPMNAILGFTQLLQRDARLEPDQRGYLDTIVQSGDHLLDLINEVLEMSKIEAGRRELHEGTVDLDAMTDELDRMFRLRAGAKQLSFAIVREEDVPRHVLADEGKLRQTLINLLGNALKFTETGSVELRVRVRRDEGGASFLSATIADTGPGIPPEEMKELFRPFHQARVGIEARGGTGLGLALSREFARLMGGDITATSTLGGGSSFLLEIPLKRAPAPLPLPQRLGQVVGIRGGRPLRILVVEDHDENRTWLRKLLETIGFEVRDAANGAEALEVFDAWTPGLVLLDLQMPVMDGYAAMRAIRARPGGRSVALVAVTASAFDDTRGAIFDAGADGWLRKPCREAALLEEIARLTAVEYRYAAEDARAPSAACGAESLSADLAARLQGAAEIADYEHVQRLIAEIPIAQAHLASELRALLGSYAYDEILRRVALCREG